MNKGIKELIKLSNELDQKGLVAEADELDGIIGSFLKSSAIHLLPDRQHSITGQTISGCTRDEVNGSSSYCAKLAQVQAKFNTFTSALDNHPKHGVIWSYLLENGLTGGLQQEWFEAMFGKYIPDPDDYEETGEEHPNFDIIMIHQALQNIVGKGTLSNFSPYRSSGGLFGPIKDGFTPDDDREKTAYGNFLEDLLAAVFSGYTAPSF